MNRTRLTRLFLCMVLATAAMPAGPLQAASASLAPHRAFYTLEATRLDDSGGISSISGKLAYEITGSDCDGYGVNYRIANRYVQGEGDPQVTDLQLTSFESGDGLELELRQKQYVNAKLDSESTIKVKKPSAGSEGKGQIEAADTKNFTTPPTVVFPTMFQKHLIAMAEKGESRDNSIVFEGSDGDKALKAISFIGPRKVMTPSAADANEEAEKALTNMAYWPMTISYYSSDAQDDASPVYQASFNMFENGVSTSLMLDYGTYALKGTLSKIEMLKPDSCK